MSTSSRLISAFFTVMPSLIIFIRFLLSGWIGREYWWITYLTVLIVLLFSSLLFGSLLPALFQKFKLRDPSVWILTQGLLSWALAFFVLELLNLTPLCVGQNNGDGNNDFAMCNLMTALSAIVYIPTHLGMLTISSRICHWVLWRK